MSHYYALAIIPVDGDLDEVLAETMAPYDENAEVERYTEDGETWWRNPRGIWDWYQVGGRWTGTLSGYDPREDPSLTEHCWLCDGTGRRNDELGRAHRESNPDYTCNGCDGTGRKPMWPTQWPRHDGDVVDALEITTRIAELPDEALPYSIFVHGAEAPVVSERWTGETFEEVHTARSMRDLLAMTLYGRMQAGHKDRVVVVDYHS